MRTARPASVSTIAPASVRRLFRPRGATKRDPLCRWISLAALAIGVSGCRPSLQKIDYDASKIDPTPVDGGTFIEPSIGDATFLNPLFASDSASGDICGEVYNGLLKYDKDVRLVGDLAESFDVQEGGRRIVFHLRKGVNWQDGVPFTSADALFTYQKLVDPAVRTPFSSDYLTVKKAEAPDPFTFVVTYDKPFAPALETWGMGIIPKHIFEKGDVNDNPANRRPIGTGPYMFKEWIPDEKIVLVANPNYFLGRPHLDRFVYRIIPDTSVQFLELRQGTWSTMTPNPDQYNGYPEFFRYYNKYHYPSWRYDYIGLNLLNPLFKDRRVRRALAMAINRKEIIQGVYEGYAVESTGPFPPQSWAYDPSVEPIPYDPEGAKKLLAEAGWKANKDGILEKDGKPFTFTLLTNEGNQVRKTIQQIVKANFERIGVNVNLRALEWSVFIHKYVDSKEFEAVLLAWNVTRDPDNYSIWHSSQRKPGQYNFISYVNPEADRLLEEGRSTFDQKKREEIYHRFHRIIADDQPYIFLATPETLSVYHKRILGVAEAPAGIGWNFEKWFIPKAWQTKEEMQK